MFHAQYVLTKRPPDKSNYPAYLIIEEQERWSNFLNIKKLEKLES